MSKKIIDGWFEEIYPLIAMFTIGLVIGSYMGMYYLGHDIEGTVTFEDNEMFLTDVDFEKYEELESGTDFHYVVKVKGQVTSYDIRKVSADNLENLDSFIVDNGGDVSE